MNSKQIGKYLLVSPLGQGNMGMVYLVQDAETGKKYALKQILLESQMSPLARQRFEQEQKILRVLQHPNIVGIQDSGIERGLPYYVMDLIEGYPLSQILSSPLAWQRALPLMVCLAETLHYAHQKSILHRDLKPQNIMIKQDGSPVLMDFGIAKILGDMQARLTLSGKILGTLAYMSPEQAMGKNKELGPASDLYSLGCIFYEMLTGKLLLKWKGKTREEILREVASSESSVLEAFPESVPLALRKICQKALEKDRRIRYCSALSLAQDIQNAFPEARSLSPLEPARQTHPESPPKKISGENPGSSYFGSYLLEKELGRGGMGIVYLATEPKTGRKVALKILQKKQAKDQARFIREARVLASLQHPNIVCLYDVEDSPELFFAMEYIEGKTLCSWLPKTRPKVMEGVLLFIQIARALDFAHAKGIVHRDIKPSNILVTKQGEPKLMDFGLAKLLEDQESLSHTSEVLGSLLYMSPEQANGKPVDTRTDIYSLGATFYEFFAGKPPFSGKTTAQVLQDIFSKEPVCLRKLNPRVPQGLEYIVSRCLQKAPQDRYPSARSLAEDLENLLENRPLQAKPIGLVQRLFLWSRRNPLAVLLLFFQGLCIFLLAFVLQNEFRKKELLLQNQNYLLSIHYKQGCSCFHQKKAEHALLYFEQALRQKNDFRSHWMMACCYLLLEKIEPAQRSLQLAWETSPQNLPQILLLQSLCHAEKKDMPRAKEVWKRVQKTFFPQAKSLESFLEQQSPKKQGQSLGFRMPLPEERHGKGLARFFLLIPLLPEEESQNALWSIGQERQEVLQEFYKIGSLLYHTDYGWQKELLEHLSALCLKDMMLYTPKKWILDMASPYWTRLDHKTQSQYAILYQRAYAKQSNRPVKKIFLEKSTEFPMVFLPPGRFLYGRAFSWEGDGPQKQILVSEAFWISPWEITQRQWERIVGSRPWYKDQEQVHDHILLHEQAPATYVSWESIQREFLSALGKDYGLPDEILWEYACRAGSTSLGLWGEENPQGYVWYKDNAIGPEGVEKAVLKKTGQKKPNAWNLYDMAGNAEEICEPERGFEDEPANQEEAKTRVYRGGNISSGINQCYSSNKDEIFLYQKNLVIGFRLVRKDSPIPDEFGDGKKSD